MLLKTPDQPLSPDADEFTVSSLYLITKKGCHCTSDMESFTCRNAFVLLSILVGLDDSSPACSQAMSSPKVWKFPVVIERPKGRNDHAWVGVCIYGIYRRGGGKYYEALPKFREAATMQNGIAQVGVIIHEVEIHINEGI
ncbi:hypothetical protein VTL71DRAFT_13201 [Oculimacula yallundae]|uniref:SWIM-type domain-containing protein n=1 Tax=Oculimacula yallundae TaxID=86028 RepID=A0ABR4CJN4_9HELO